MLTILVRSPVDLSMRRRGRKHRRKHEITASASECNRTGAMGTTVARLHEGGRGAHWHAGGRPDPKENYNLTTSSDDSVKGRTKLLYVYTVRKRLANSSLALCSLDESQCTITSRVCTNPGRLKHMNTITQEERALV